MNLENQLIFFFSAIGAFNGLFLSIYFAFLVKNRNRSTYFLSALLFVISVRVAKSVFMTFVPGLSSDFIQVGLSACLLIGPFLYLYVKNATGKRYKQNWVWLIHILPIIIIMIIIGYYFPYREHRYLWQRSTNGYLGWTLFAQWLIYIVLSAIAGKDSFKRLFSSKVNSSNLDFWLVNIIVGVWIVWLAYFNGYTSYIVGALSFSFTFYVSVLIWVFKKRKAGIFFDQNSKYANKKKVIDSGVLNRKIDAVLSEGELFRNPDLKLADLANELGVAPHYLSQYLNENLGKSFSAIVNEHRINAAELMIQTQHHLTLEAIGTECGFQSNSSFYNAFKKFKGMTPAKLRKINP